ncbi:hypothetical protein AX15_001882 [Amanita polypyramis BW_CC]|nr:hypothetical protein AX15_001882 [Amanita polypyramis BW_CC]
MASRQAFRGPKRKLLIAFDIGTTFSGVSYSILDPGIVPEINEVNRFPSQLHGHSKIPSVVYYDSRGVAKAVGAEAVQDSIDEIAKENGWKRASWFKLHLRPKLNDTVSVANAIPPLPAGVTVIDIFADLLRYLYRCTKDYIEQSHASGEVVWRSVEKQTHFVLTHPNGWGGYEQWQMKRAVVKAGLVASMDAADEQVSFVTEGEASLNYCICSGLSKDAFKDGRGVIIVDAGGGTVDISGYRRGSPSGNKYEEIAAPQCHMKGSVFVTHNAETFLRAHLRGSQFSGEDEIKVMIKEFDEHTKLFFRRSEDPQFIRFGGLRDNDASKDIRSGQLKLPGLEAARFFAPSLQCILDAVLCMKDNAKEPVSSVFLVGGFSASDYLFSQIKEALQQFEIAVYRPDGHLNKAVANGAVSFYVDHYVNTRVSKATYGNSCSYSYNPNDSEHLKRVSQVYESPSKKRYVQGAFDVILYKVSLWFLTILFALLSLSAKDTRVSEMMEFRRSYWYTSTTRDNLRYIKNEIISYRGVLVEPRWMDIDKG